MPWIIGVDEAGYGPNLGPFVMSVVACRVPEDLVDANLWQALQPAVRRHKEPGKGRLLIDDSKLVHSGTHALRNLETALWSVLGPPPQPFTVTDLIQRYSPKYHDELVAEFWYNGTTPLPLLIARERYRDVAERFQQTCAARQIHLGFIRSVIVCPKRFNALLDRYDNKGAVLAVSLAELVRAAQEGCPDEALYFFVDKHGGRNSYASLLQPAFEDGVVMATMESAQRSAYRLQGAKRPMHVVFQPRADADHLCVALASMLSKYVREVLMVQFNQFWQKHLPEVKATAGYPTDAVRFFADIKDMVQRLQIAEETLWRRK